MVSLMWTLPQIVKFLKKAKRKPPSGSMMIGSKPLLTRSRHRCKRNAFRPIYIIITKNIRYLLWNWGFWRSLNNTYPIFLTLCIRCTNHLCDSCDLTGVNPHFIPSLLRKIKNVDLLCRPPAIVTSQWLIVPAWLLQTLSWLSWLMLRTVI